MAEEGKLRYSVLSVPPLPVLLSVPFQHVLMSLPGCLATSFIVSDILCLPPASPMRTQLFSSTLFMCGVGTILQTMLGLRLPVFQGPSSSFLPALLAVQNNDEWLCPKESSGHPDVNMTSASNITDTTSYMPVSLKLQKLSGSLMAASAVEILVGGTGVIGVLLRFIGPITVAPTISLIGISLYKVPIIYSRPSWEIAFVGALLVLVFTLYCRNKRLTLPIRCGGKKSEGANVLRIFQLLPILMGMVIVWCICGVLTVSNAFPDDPKSLRYRARTDAKSSLLSQTPWFIIPHPGQFGMPGFSVAVFIGFCAAFFASMIESVGDYFAASRACEVQTPPRHAVNRGILIEGLGGLLSGAVGVGHATTSYSANIAAISMSSTASRGVMVITGIILLICAFVGKFGAFIATIPDPALGGALIVICGMLVSLGLSTLSYVNLNSPRNLTILGVAIFVGIFLPEWLKEYPDFINTGSREVDGVLKVITGAPMFLGGVIAIILDNTVQGTLEERGMLKWQHKTTSTDGMSNDGHGVTSNEAYSWSCLPALVKCLPFIQSLPFIPKVRQSSDTELITNDKSEPV